MDAIGRPELCGDPRFAVNNERFRIAAHRGKGRAAVAVGHSVLVAIYHMLTRCEPYHALVARYCDEHERERVRRQLVHRLQRLSFDGDGEALSAPSWRFSEG